MLYELVNVIALKFVSPAFTLSEFFKFKSTYKVDSGSCKEVEEHGADTKSVGPRDIVVLGVHHPVPAIGLTSKNWHSQKQEKSYEGKNYN